MKQTLRTILPFAIRLLVLIGVVVSRAAEPAPIQPLKKYNPDGTPAELSSMITDGKFEVAADGVYHIRCGRTEEDRKRRKKLESIIIPKVDFQNTALPEAIKILVEKSKEADPEKEGVAMELKGYDPAPGTLTEITLTLTNVPLLEAIKYVTALANFKYSITPLAVTLSPIIPESITPPTMEWEVRPDYVERLHKHFAPNTPLPSTVRIVLEDAGIPFPKGTIVIFQRERSHLIVKNSDENLDLIDAALRAADAGSHAENPTLFVYDDETEGLIYQRSVNGDPALKPVQLKAGKCYHFNISGCRQPSLWLERVP